MKQANVWLNTHKLLPDSKKLELVKKVMEVCEWSQSTFYRKLKAPATLKLAEKKLIAKAYGKRPATFFPELEAIPL